MCGTRRGNSLSMMSDCGLDDRSLIPDTGKGFFPLASASRPALGLTSCLMSNGSHLLWRKARPGRDAAHPPYLVPPLPLSATMACSRIALRTRPLMWMEGNTLQCYSGQYMAQNISNIGRCRTCISSVL
jgi:hypothetical protein